MSDIITDDSEAESNYKETDRSWINKIKIMATTVIYHKFLILILVEFKSYLARDKGAVDLSKVI